MKLKRKIITIFLSCFLFISSTVSSFAFAPVIALAPEVFSAIATTLVCAGVKFSDYNTLNKSVRDVYESEGFITKCLPQLEQDIKNTKDGVVTLSKNVVDWFNVTFFPKVVKGQNVLISNLPCYRAGNKENFYYSNSNSAGYPVSPIYDVPFDSNIDISLGGGYKLVHSSKSDFVSLKNSLNKEITYCDIEGTHSNGEYKGKIAIIYFDGSMFISQLAGTRWFTTSINILTHENFNSSDTATWTNSGGLPYLQNPSDSGTLDIPVAGDVTDLVNTNGWNPSVDQVWNPSKPVDVPKQSEGDLVVPGDSIIDKPIDPPVEIPQVEIDFSPFVDAMNNFKEKFPFSLPWDFKRVFDVLNVPSKSPDFNLPLAGFEFNVEFSQFDLWIRIFKYFIYLIFVLGLIFITNKLKP